MQKLPLFFQAIDWNSEDIRIVDDDESDDDINQNYNGKRKWKPFNLKYVIKAYGRTYDGKAISLNIRNYTPYFYLKGIDHIAINKHSIITQKITDYITSNIPGIFSDSVVKCRIVNKYDIWGFTNKEVFRFIQITFKSHGAMRQAIKLFERIVTIPGLFNRHKLKLYESNIEPLFRFMHRQKIDPTGWLMIEPDNYTVANDYTTIIGETYDVEWNHVRPYTGPECNGTAPFLISSFDIECDSFDGSFPDAIKLYNMVAYQTTEHYAKIKLIESRDPKTGNLTGNKKLRTPRELEGLITDYLCSEFQEGRINTKILVDNKEFNRIKSIILDNIQDICGILDGRINILDDLVDSSVLYQENHKSNKAQMQKSIRDYFNSGCDDDDGDNAGIDDNTTEYFKTNKSSQIIMSLSAKFDKIFPKLNGDPVIQIGITTHRYGDRDCFDKQVIVVGGCDPIIGVTVIQCQDEKELIRQFVKVFNQINPDMVTGYNTFGFDFDYIYNRAVELGPLVIKELCYMGKLREPLNECLFQDNRGNPYHKCKTHFVKKELSSAALGDNFLKFINMEGRVNMDMMKQVQKDYKLDTYKLDFVAQHFISGKIKPSGINVDTNEIMIDNATGLLPGNFVIIDEYKLKLISVNVAENIITVSDNDKDILLTITCNSTKTPSKWGLAKDDVSPAEIFACQRGSDADRARVAKYCVQDCALCNFLVIKLEIVANNVGMSNVCCVPFSYIFLRGQGVKILSLFARECKKENYLLPHLDKKWECTICGRINSSFNEVCKFTKAGITIECGGLKPERDGYEGAIVLVPEPGIYTEDPIAVLDYASLYPSSMISENISHDTIVTDSKYDNLPGLDYLDIKYNTYKGNGETKIKTGETTSRFVQLPNNEKGLLPRILQKLLTARKATRKKIPWKTVNMLDGSQVIGTVLDDHVKSSDEVLVINEQNTTIREIMKENIKNISDTHNEFQKAILDGLQLAYKLTANSIYGQVGAATSPICMKELAESTTATGRNLILQAKKFAEDEYNAKIIYGDSIPFDEPVVIRDKKTQQISVKMISELASGKKWKDYETFKDPDYVHTLRNVLVKIILDGCESIEECEEYALMIPKYLRKIVLENRIIIKRHRKNPEVILYLWKTENSLNVTESDNELINEIDKICSMFKMDTDDRSQKQQKLLDYEVWTDNGWQKILRVIRHKTQKKIHRISTGFGVVDVTEDHSLCNSAKLPIKPNEVKIGETELLHHEFDLSNQTEYPAIIPKYPSEFYGENLENKQKYNDYEINEKFTCTKCKESLSGDNFYWTKKNNSKTTKAAACKLCTKKKQCETKGVPFTGTLSRKITDIQTVQYPMTPSEAWVWGFFLGDGSCGEYRCPSGLKSSWALNNQCLDRLNHAKEILELIEPNEMKFKILETMKSSGVYKLVPTGSLRYMVHKYRTFMYDDLKQKRVPDIILNASYSVRKAFFDGYYEADGTKGKEGKYVTRNNDWTLTYKNCNFTAKGKVTAQGLYILAVSLGLKISVRRWKDKDRIYTMNSYNPNINMKRNKIRYNEEAILHKEDDGYVYDVETITGRFSVGIGTIVAIQTDSIFIKLPRSSVLEKSLTETESKSERDNLKLQYNIDVGLKLEKEFQKHLKPPHYLEWEKMFYPFVIFSKKRYVGNKYEFDIHKYKQTSMGIVLKRRDNANIVKIIYGGVLDIILNEGDIEKSLKFLDTQLERLVKGEVPIEDLIITKTLKGFYKNPNQIAHKVLADRMRKRDPGSAPQANDRVAYVYIMVNEKTLKQQNGWDYRVLQGDKIEDPQFIRDHKLSMDYEHYITNQLMKPISQLYSLILEDLKGFKHKERTYYANLKKAKIDKKRCDLQLSKEEISEKDHKKIHGKINDLREKEIKDLLFDKHLRKLSNKRLGNRNIIDFFDIE
jgi:DNA polymerase elongation subunit (family B)